MAKEQQETLGFEDALKRLEALVAKMESGELDLDKMIKAFEEGQKLVQVCTAKLNAIEQKIEKIVKQPDGSVATEPFAPPPNP